MICVIDYGVGNLRSITRGLERAGATVKLTRSIEDVSEAEAVVLPGVGAFRDALENLEPLKERLLQEVKGGKPLLGICLGLQLLFEESAEGGHAKGLALIKGRVVRLPSNVKVPHIGWNTIEVRKECPLLSGVGNAYLYFVHSYYAVPEEEGVVAATTRYGVEFPSVIWKENIFATQFHPEKSGEVGLRILRNFVRTVKEMG